MILMYVNHMFKHSRQRHEAKLLVSSHQKQKERDKAMKMKKSGSDQKTKDARRGTMD